MGSLNSKENSETIGWANIKTENISSTMPKFNGLSNDAKKLIASLNIPSVTETESSVMNIDNILNKINTGLNKTDKEKFNQLLEEVSSNSESLSSTSPFITTEMYERLINSKTSESEKVLQLGGAKNGKKSKQVKTTKQQKKPVKKTTSRQIKSKGGGKTTDSSDTSSTSTDSSSSLADILDSTEQEIIEARNKKHAKHNKNKNSKSDSELSGGNLSYLSSSAHTDGVFSDSSNNKSKSSSVYKSRSYESSSDNESSSYVNSTTVSTTDSKPKNTYNKSRSTNKDSNTSVTNENYMMSTSISVDTNDINMISDYN